MTIRPRVVRALRDARERLRDAAAASHASATTARSQSEENLSDSCDRLEVFLDDAREVLAGARSVHDIAHVEQISQVHRIEIADAQARHDEAIAYSEKTGEMLRERTRQLKSAEKIVEIVTDYVGKRDATAEQKANDDIAAGRKR